MIPCQTGQSLEDSTTGILLGGLLDDRYRRKRRAAELRAAKSSSKPASTSADQGDPDDESDWSEVDFDNLDFREEPQLLLRRSEMPKFQQKLWTLVAAMRSRTFKMKKPVLISNTRRGDLVVQFLDMGPKTPPPSGPKNPAPQSKRPNYTRPAATAADLPVELLPEIATHVAELLIGHNGLPIKEHKRAIGDMSLVSRTWTNSFRGFLFAYVNISSLQDLRAFAAILDHPPLRGIIPVWRFCLIVGLVISEAVLLRPWLHHAFDILNAQLLKRNPNVALSLSLFGPGFAGGSAARPIRSIHALLPRSLPSRHYSRFHTLQLLNVDFGSFAHLVRLIDDIPVLQRIYCSNLTWPLESGRSTKRPRRIWRESPSLACIYAAGCPDAHALFRMMSRKLMKKNFYCVPESEISVMLDLFRTFDIRARDAASAPSWVYNVRQDDSPFATMNHTTSLDFQVTNITPPVQGQPTEFVFSTCPYYLSDGTGGTPASSPLAPYELSIQYIIIKVQKGNIKEVADLDWPAFTAAVLRFDRLDGVMIGFPDSSSWVAFIDKCSEAIMPLWSVGRMSFAVFEVREDEEIGLFAGWWPVEGRYTSPAAPVGYHTMTYDCGLKLLCRKVWADAPRVADKQTLETEKPIMLEYAY